VAAGNAQSFTINGSNFDSTCTVTLDDITQGTTYPNRTISSWTDTNHHQPELWDHAGRLDCAGHQVWRVFGPV
jgi:hypothetical protein